MNELPKQLSMKLATGVAIALLLLGVSLLFVGHLFAWLGWHDAFRGTVTGLVITISAVVGFLAFCLRKSLEVSRLLPPIGTKRLSSSLTLFVRFFVPYYLLAAGFIASTLTYFSAYAMDIFWPVFSFFLFLFLVSCYFNSKIYDVFERPDSFLVSRFGSVSILPKTAGLVVGNYLPVASLKSPEKTYFYLPALSSKLTKA